MHYPLKCLQTINQNKIYFTPKNIVKRIKKMKL
jgi:hypothetical protein